MSEPLNNENEKCNKCGKPTVPLFFGRKRWCPDCEKDKKNDGVKGPDYYGSWRMYDPDSDSTGGRGRSSR